MNDIEFAPSGLPPSDDLPDPGRPVAATWQNKATKFSGRIEFEYLVDATGRAGIMSTKYLKNRKMNDGRQLKNVASWGYWDNAADFAVGTPIQGTPYFECLGGKCLCFVIPIRPCRTMTNSGSRRRKRLGLVYSPS